MAGETTPLMQQLSGQMRYLTQRQATLSQNIANIDTPGYRAKDLKQPDFATMSETAGPRLPMRVTSPKHLTGTTGSSAYTAQDVAKTYEVNPSKNSVSLDEEMAKISDTGAQYQMSSSLLRKYTSMYRSAVGAK